ncbi:MAG: preprotein translocase subunit SecE [Nitrospinae bacterium]|nr:preprotein translocase subunit SecE [Nitrospinota bacterium]
MSEIKPNPVQQGVQFLSEARNELKKVAWPTRKETTGITWVVIATSFVMSIYLGVVDWFLAQIIKVLVR